MTLKDLAERIRAAEAAVAPYTYSYSLSREHLARELEVRGVCDGVDVDTMAGMLVTR